MVYVENKMELSEGEMYNVRFKVNRHSKINFFVGFPPSVQDFFVIEHVHSNV